MLQLVGFVSDVCVGFCMSLLEPLSANSASYANFLIVLSTSFGTRHAQAAVRISFASFECIRIDRERT